MKTVAILYGWSEGPWHTKKLATHLKAEGFNIINDVKTADVILAHSLGCYMLPANVKAKKIVLIGIPYWPGRSIVDSLIHNLRLEAKQRRGFTWWLNRSIHAAFYILLRSPYTIKGLRKRSKLKFNLPPKNTDVVLIRNELDGFCHPDIQKLIPKLSKYSLKQLPGGHEDWWINPKTYVDILKKL